MKMDITTHKFVILGSYTANVLGQVRGLGERGIHPYGVLIHKNTFRIDKSKYWTKVFCAETIEEGLDIVIREFGNETVKPFLYTDRDDVMGLIDRKYDMLKDKFYLWNAGEQGRLNKYLNKAEQLRLAEECGMRIPQTEVVKVGEMPQHLTYPIFTKAKDSLNPYWKGNAYICYNEEDLKKVYSIIDIQEIMLQEYIVKEDEHPIEGISLNGGKDIRLLVKSVNYRFTKDSYGIFRHLEPFYDEELGQKIKSFIRAINYTGIFEIEFIIDKKGVPYFLETNFRITQYNYGYTKFGINFPVLFAKSILKGEIDTDEIKHSNIRPFNVMSELEDFRISCLHGDVSMWQWIKDVKRTNCFSFYAPNDKRPFYWTLWEKTINGIKKLI